MKKQLLLVLPFFMMACSSNESYLDPKLPVEKRVDLLMKEMTLEEKIGQMNLDFDIPEPDFTEQFTSDRVDDIKYNKAESESLKERWIADVKAGRMGVTRNIRDYKLANEFQRYAEESRLKIPLFIVDNFVHGVGKNGYCTFPTYVSMANSFNPELVRKMGAVTAREGRLFGINWTFAPTVDVSRDSRWGRTGETWGEDPYLASQMGSAVVKGMQEDNPMKSRIVACLKHYVAGGQAQNGINFAPVDISDRTLREIYLPPFKAAIDAGALTIMCGHNDVNGIPCHCSKYLLTDVLRKDLGYKGLVITDFRDIERLVMLHKVAKNFKEAIDMSINAGIDIHNHGKLFIENMLELVKEGKISEQRINDAVRAILTVKFKFGLFENRYVSEEDFKNNICTEEDKQLALELARQSIVLLKNNDDILPLKGNQKVLVTGTNADNFAIMGDWVHSSNFDNAIKIVDGFKMEKPDNIQLDCFATPSKKYVINQKDIDETVRRAQKADVVVLVIGGSSFRGSPNRTSGENVDVQDIELFGNQMELLEKVKATGKKVITVLVGGRNLAFEEADKYCDALIQAWEPGMMGGKALAEIVYGKVSPSGKLCMSMPRTNGQVHVWYSNNPSTYFRSFRFGNMGSLYPFGHGLSYTTFKYSNLKFAETVKKGEKQTISVDVTNTGKMAADEVVLCYINDKVSSVVTPLRKLVDFERISLKPGETKTVTMEVNPDQMALYNADMKRVIEPGTFELKVGTLTDAYEVVE